MAYLLAVLPSLLAGGMAKMTDGVYVCPPMQSSMQGRNVCLIVATCSRVARYDQHLQRGVPCVSTSPGVGL